jgi:hypothetical protein
VYKSEVVRSFHVQRATSFNSIDFQFYTKNLFFSMENAAVWGIGLGEILAVKGLKTFETR